MRINPSLIVILLLGFFSGLPLALTASTLTAWLSMAGVEKAAIGLFAAVATPYTLKFLWAPLIDGLRIPILCDRLGRRRGWLVLVQALLTCAIFLLGMNDPAQNAWMCALLAFFVAAISATQDIVIDAYRVELLPQEQQGNGAAYSVLGYRIGMIASGAGALYLADIHGWHATYTIMAAIMAAGVGVTLLAKKPVPSENLPGRRSLTAANFFRTYVLDPFRDFTLRKDWLAILAFIALYKLGDAFLGIMTNPFLLEIGFSLKQIAAIVKVYGVIATILGGFAGGWLVTRWGMVKSLWVCGIAHALTNAMFLVQARVGADINILALGITLENFSGGMGTAAFVAFLSALCNQRFTATQYALLSALASLARTFLSTPAGWVAQRFGWESFFLISILLAAPGLWLLRMLSRRNTFVEKKSPAVIDLS